MKIWITSCVKLESGWTVCYYSVGNMIVCFNTIYYGVIDDNGSVYFMELCDLHDKVRYKQYIYHSGVDWSFGINSVGQVSMYGNNGAIIREEGHSCDHPSQFSPFCKLITDDDNISTLVIMHEGNIIKLSIGWKLYN